MKRANTIISHILRLPQFKPLQKYYCYRRFVSQISPKWRKAIAFVYTKQDTLFIALRHPGFKMELNYNQDLLKSILSILREQDKRCEFMVINNIVVFNSKHNSILKKEEIPKTITYYYELAQGEFEVESEDKKLIEAFNRIKNNIIKNKH